MLRSVQERDWQTNELLACRHSCNIKSLFAIRPSETAPPLHTLITPRRLRQSQPDRPARGVGAGGRAGSITTKLVACA